MRYFMNISYAGTNYHGWQIQSNAVTVQSVVNDSISKIVREPVNVVGCGRTDTGVHASKYVLHFDVVQAIPDCNKFLYRINSVIPADIVVHQVEQVLDSCHARFDANLREYHYFFLLTRNPFLHQFATRLVKTPNLDLLNSAAKLVLQQHDFASFCKAHGANKTTICDVSDCSWSLQNDFLIFKIRANRFLRNMVRALTGTMLDIGFGKRTLGEFQQIFDAKDRSSAGLSVDPNGLFLTGIWYENLPEMSGSKLPFYTK